jgi:NAD(P)H-flavin reductase
MSTASEKPESIQVVNPLLPRFLRIRRVLKETHDTTTLEIDDSTSAPPFAAGQFNMLYLFGAGEVAASRNPVQVSASLMRTEEHRRGECTAADS